MSAKNISLGIVVQARKGSTRLPGKVTLNFYDDQCILDLIIDKFSDPYFDSYTKILATSNSNLDLSLKSYCRNSFQFFVGSEDDVLERFINAGDKYNLTHIVRICADNPLLNVMNIKVLIDQLFMRYALNESVDYLSFKTGSGLPTIKSHLGLFVEIVSVEALRKASMATNKQLYHEHVTNFLYENVTEFEVVLLPAPEVIYNRYDIRLTIDDAVDFELMKDLYAKTTLISEDLNELVSYIDNDIESKYKNIMSDNINKYTK